MSRRLRTAGRALAVAGVAILAGGGPGAAAPRPASRLLVYAQEWHLFASRAVLPAGPVSVELWNRGQDAHDLRVRRLSPRGAYGPVDGAAASTDSGQIRSAVWTLRPGRYELYCAMPGHMAAGMHSELTVT